jgi:hypothetical protein
MMPEGKPFGQRFVHPMPFREWLAWMGYQADTHSKAGYDAYVANYNQGTPCQK